MQDPPFYCKWFLSIDNSVRRLLLLKIVLHSLFADAIDGLRPDSGNADPFWWISGWSICLKKTYFHSGRNNYKSEVNTWVFIGPAYQGSFVATWEYKKIEESFGIRMLFPKISAENVHSWYPLKQFWPKIQTARWNRLQTMQFVLSIHMLNSYGLPVRWRQATLPVS